MDVFDSIASCVLWLRLELKNFSSCKPFHSQSPDPTRQFVHPLIRDVRFLDCQFMKIAELTTIVGFSKAANMLSNQLDILEDGCEKILLYHSNQQEIAELCHYNKNDVHLFKEARQTLDNCFGEVVKLHDLLKIKTAKECF